MALLEVKDLRVEVGGKEVVKGANLEVNPNEIRVLLGPNASGKTSLLMAIMGHPAYKVRKGEILFDGVNVVNKPAHERAKMGLALSFQNPPEIRGIKLRDLIRIAAGKEAWNPLKEPREEFSTSVLASVGLDPTVFRDRDVNVGFSGGEKKRSELAQVLAMKPKLMLLDEPDSGVDVDSLKEIGIRINTYVRESCCSALVVTHYRHILPYIRPCFAYVMCNGIIVASGDPYEIFSRIEEVGYCAYANVCPPAIRSTIEGRVK